MRKGATTAIVMILVMLITISLVLMSYQWLLKYSPQTQQELEKNLEVKKGCLKIENIDTGNKKITVRNCGDVDLSNFIIYLDSGPFAYYTGVLGAGGITQISYTGNINYGDHEIFVSSNYAETPKIVFYKPPCDIYVYQYMIPFVITESNKFYCLVENVHIDGKNAINFSSSIQNSTLNCQNYNIDGNDAGNTNGVYLSNNNKNTVRNCNVTDFYQGIYILNSNSNILINNTASSNEYGIELEFANYNTLLNNIDLDVTYLWGSGYNTLTNNKMTSYIRLFGTLCVNNNITGGSIASFSPYDYELDSAGAFNYFRNTNFTGSRKIHSLNSWFNYNNDTTGELWLKTNVSFIGACVVPCMIITRKLINWNNTLLQWNDSYDVVGMARYNVTGLKSNKWYLVYNNSKITYALKTDSSGSLPSFTIYLPANEQHEIKVEAISGLCDVPIISFSDTYVIDQNNTYYCLFKNFNINNKNAINFTSGVQNSTLDCRGYNIDGNDSYFDGVQLAESDTKNNIVKNCNITNFGSGIYVYNYAFNNSLINNTLTSNTRGIYLWLAFNNTLINNKADSNNIGILLYNMANYNKLINNSVNFNTILCGIRISGASSNNVLINNTLYKNEPNICIVDSENNTIDMGSITSANNYDYYLEDATSTNNFTNVNFTNLRKIYFYDSSSWFNYNNETTGNIWLKTSVSSAATLTRKLINWSQILMKWNDTASAALTARYNITGLLTNTNYNVYNNTIAISGSPFNSGSTGQISFTINLPIGQEREIKVQISQCNYPFFGNWNIFTNVVCSDQLIIINGNITIQNGGSLTLRNVTLLLNSTYNGQCGIEVQSGGGMYIYDKDNNKYTTNDATNITAVNISNRFYFIVDSGSIFDMENSFLSECGYNAASCFTGDWTDCTGLKIFADNSVIVNNTLNYGYRIISLKDAKNVSVSGNTIKNGENYGVLIVDYSGISQNNVISDNTLINNYHNIHTCNGAKNNTITRNNITGGTYGIHLHGGSGGPALYNNYTFNNISSATYGIYIIEGSHDNLFANSSVTSSGQSDYYLANATSTNNFINMNFTATRKIYFNDTFSWFNYQNDSSQNIWLKTSVSPLAVITRKLINWNQTLIRWNDTFSNTSGSITARYNVSGLLPNINYNVYNNSVIAYTINSSSNGEISFTINLPANQEHEIRVEKSSSSNWFSGWNYRKNHTIMNSTGADVSYTINITVINATGTDSGSIVYINSTGNSKTRSDFGDIRFTNSTGSLLNYWMETLNSGANATFWVQIDGNLTSTNQTIYIYYGNNTATNISNITNTFLFGDDFLGTSSNVAPSGWNSTLVGTKKFNESLKNSWFTLLNLTSTSAAWSGVNLNKSIPTISNNFYAQALLSSNVTVGVAGQTELYLSLYSGSTEEYYSGFGDSWNSGTGDNASYITGTSGGGAKNIQDGAVNVSFGISLTGGTATTYYNKISTQTKSSVTQSFNIVMIRLHSAAIVTNQIEAIDYIWIRSYVSPEPGHNAWGSEESFL